MNIKIIAVGKIKEKFTKEAIAEFEKRLSAYCSFSVYEVPAENIFEEKLAEKYKEIEADNIISQIKASSYVVTLEILGKSLSSEDFARKLKTVANEGYNEVVFIIGGANGLHEKVSARADYKLSFSKMTFTHQMIRVLLYEQIYRAFKIINNENNHR